MKKKILFIIINLFLTLSTIAVSYYTLSHGTVAGQVDTGANPGWFYIVTFTVESNIFLGVVSAVATILGIRSIVLKKSLSRHLSTWYLIATSSVILTFLTVVCFLAPIRAMGGRNYFDMLIGPMFFFHFFNPVLAAFALVFLLGHRLKFYDCYLSILPPAIYSVPYSINVVLLTTWPDFYGFTFGGHYLFVPLVFIAICLFTFGIATALASAHNFFLTKSTPRTSEKFNH
ncbi:MAG: hypothetical protein Q4A79_00135 [Candidatus Saccharibacteria bacterium]|nr:hypothetical protein [Candidatus Saccharibacteria bacterium]